MRFVSIYRPRKMSPPTPQLMEAMGKFIQESVQAGVLLATEGFGPSTPEDFKVRLTEGKCSIVDGPFAEAKEVIGGFAVMQVKSREEMVEWTRRFLAIGGDEEAEIHPLGDVSPIDAFTRR